MCGRKWWHQLAVFQMTSQKSKNGILYQTVLYQSPHSDCSNVYFNKKCFLSITVGAFDCRTCSRCSILCPVKCPSGLRFMEDILKMALHGDFSGGYQDPQEVSQ